MGILSQPSPATDAALCFTERAVAKTWPQFLQNLAPAAFVLPHFGQFIFSSIFYLRFYFRWNRSRPAGMIGWQ
jgi:hypothetical protein